MRTRIAKEFRFEAAHHLPNHRGKCRRQHGHSYRVRVVVEGEPKELDGHSSDEGMIIDFAKLSAVWTNHLEKHLDHQDLNETTIMVPTAERLASWMFALIEQHLPLPPKAMLKELTVWETDTSSATVYG